MLLATHFKPFLNMIWNLLVFIHYKAIFIFASSESCNIAMIIWDLDLDLIVKILHHENYIHWILISCFRGWRANTPTGTDVKTGVGLLSFLEERKLLKKGEPLE